VAFCFDVVPDVFELAIRADEKGTSHDAEKRFAEEFLHAARAVGFDRFQIWITEKVEIEFLLGFEAGLGFDGVAAHAENDHAQLVELLFCVTKLGRFGRSTGSVGLGIEKENDALAEKVGERDVVAGVILQAECRGFVAYLDHVFRILRRASRLSLRRE
jgi:hypothetical protein